MDVPAGTSIREGMDTANVDFRKLFPTLRQHRLNGYVALDIMTNNGIEDAVLLFVNGEATAGIYNYLSKGLSIKADDALPLFMNACVGDGRFDIVELASDDVLDVREKNRDAVFKYKPTEKELLAFLPDSFTEKSVEEKKEAVSIKPEAIKGAGGVSREELLKKYNITHPDKRAVDKLLDGIVSS